MTIEHAFDADGGFIALDRERGLAGYAYPSSVYATSARNKPAVIAGIMIAAEARSMGGVKRRSVNFAHMSAAFDAALSKAAV